jgi:pimeloyl-ACP methyl ester carboxylesterase
MQPRSHVWHLNGLAQHVLEWPAAGAGAPASVAEGSAGGASATAVLVHGFQDVAATWDDVAGSLARAGLRVLVPDMRGFGDGPRVAAGSYYYFPDYVADVAALLRAEVTGPLFLVGHSMGATVVTYFAGAFPERVTKLALVDGVGPPTNEPDIAPTRMRRWIEMARDAPSATRKAMTRADALSRLARYNPDVAEAVLAHKLTQLANVTREASGPDDELAWKYDPLHTTVSPIPFYGEAYKAFARLVTCPVLHLSGGTKGHHVSDEEERLACFPKLARVTIEGGHALHWTKPAELSAALVQFWGG